MNWPALALLLVGLSGVGGFFFGADWKEKSITAQVQHDAEKHMEALELVATEIARVKVIQKNTTQVLEKEIQTRVEYKDCRHTPAAFETLNEALTQGVKK